MKHLLDRISEKTARILALCFLAGGILLLAAALWINFGGLDNSYTTTTYSRFTQQTVYGKPHIHGKVVMGGSCLASLFMVMELKTLTSMIEDSDVKSWNQRPGTEFIEIDERT